MQLQPRRVLLEQLRIFLCKIERIGKLSGRKNSHRLLVKAIHRVHHSTLIGRAPNTVELLQQTHAVIQPLGVQAGNQLEVHLMILTQARELALHTRFQLALE